MAPSRRVVLILRSGGDFGFADVELVAKRIKQQEPEAEIYCLFDKITSPLVLKELTILPMAYQWPGWWAKMNLFDPELDHLRPFLYVDLDTAVVGKLDKILPPENQDQFICLEDFYRQDWLASGLMWIPNCDKVKRVWEEWSKAPEKHIKRWRGDQDFLRSVVEADVFWQELTNRISSFKPRVLRGWLKYPPQELALICFHGYPRIFEAARTVKWVKNYINQE